ncbi:unnamed protein product, partial [Pelagomonas calceolata]
LPIVVSRPLHIRVLVGRGGRRRCRRGRVRGRVRVGAVRAVALELPVPPADAARVFGLEPLRDALQVERVATHAPDHRRAIPRIHDARRAALEGELADAAHVAVHVVAPGPARDGVPVEDVHLEGHGSLLSRRRVYGAFTARVYMRLFSIELLLRSNAVRAFAAVPGELWAHEYARTDL